MITVFLEEGDPNAAQKVFILGNKCQEFQKHKGIIVIISSKSIDV